MNRLPIIKSSLRLAKHIQALGSCHQPGVRLISTQDYKPGSSLPHGWNVVESTSVPELSLPAVIHLQHKFCGAQLIHFANPSDETNAFSVNFKTVPQDSTGIAHILEHVTLCGSEKYPVRDPFFKMLNRSLSTFMNAMTGPDYTMYPFATQNKKDFYNLLSVYLDAVFKPLLKETDFRQEGWRLSEEKGKLTIKGVVFNEMKGVFADSQTIFGEALLNSILPSNTYGHVSGGLPEKIPDLTWKNLQDFHKVHYSADNARFYTYGNLQLEEHLKALSSYLPEVQRDSSVYHKVSAVPPEPRWSSPVRKHISCPSDASSTSNTIALAYLVSDISDVYENFVMKIISELLIEGPNAPFYQSLIEAGLGTGFSPSSGYETSTRDTIFSVGLQGISMDNANHIEKTIKKTFEDVIETGFDAERIQAILHRTELSLKKQVNNFGLNLIFGLTPNWNHVENPLPHLHINALLDRFRRDIENPKFLTDKVRKHFVDNNHYLILTMSPDEKFVAERESILSDLESNLVRNLTESSRAEVLDMDRRLSEEQATKDIDESLACLPSLQMEDIPLEKPVYKFQSTSFGQYCVQPTNGVSFFRALLSTDCLESNPTYKQYLPLFTMALTQMGAGEKYSFRQFDTVTDLYTGGLSVSHHMAESPFNAAELKKKGLLLSSCCLDRNSEKMFELWSDLLSGAFKTSDSSAETSLEALVLRLGQLINMSAVDAVNGVAHSGHHYAMSHAASKLEGYPAAEIREKQGGLAMVRFLSQLSKSTTESGTEVFDILSSMSELLLRSGGNNLRGVALNMTQEHATTFVAQTEKFVDELDERFSGIENSSISESLKVASEPSTATVEKKQKTYIATPFPVHYCGLALPAVPYNHVDSAPLRILAKLLTSKFLLSEIREKGGAYGGGATSSPISGLFTFYSYRDPNFESTLETFQKSSEWVLRKDSFNERDIVEAKLGVFQSVDSPVLPGSRGLGQFLSGISDEMFLEHRRRLRDVTRDDLIRVSEKYLTLKNNFGISAIGPESSTQKLDSSWDIQQLVV